MNKPAILFIICFAMLLFFGKSNTIKAQSRIDSLKIQVIKVSDLKKQAEIYYELADFYYYINLDSSILYAKQYLESSKLAKDTAWIADAYNFIAYTYDQKGEVKLALEYFEKALDKFILLEDSFYIASSYTNIGYMTSYGMDQAKGLTYFMEAMQIAEEVKDPGLLADISSNIAYYYYRVNDFKTALRYYSYSLDNSILAGDSLYIAIGYANVASINLRMEEYDIALDNFDKSKKMLPKNPNNYDFANYCLSVTDSYIIWNQTDSAELYLDKAEYLITKYNYQILEAYLYQNKGNFSFLKKSYKESIAYLDTSIILFTNTNTIEPFLDIYAKKAEAFSKLNLFKEAYIILEEANRLNKSLGYGILANMLGEFEQKRINQVREQNMELENNLLKQKDENYSINMKSRMRTAVFSILFLICILAVVFYFLWRIRNKNRTLKKHNNLIRDQKALVEQNIEKLEISEKNFKELNATKDKFFSIIAHDLKNPFSSLASFTEILLTDKEVRESEKFIPLLERMNETASYGYNLLSDLLEWARSQTGNIIPKPEKMLLKKTLEKVVSDFSTIANEKNIRFDLQVNSPKEVLADENMINTVLRNLIHNALKFSYENGIVRIHSYVKEDFLVTSIEDKGIGISEKELSALFSIDKDIQKPGTKNEKGTGLGLVLCKEFVSKNKGHIWAEGHEKKGCKFSFSLPLYKKKLEVHKEKIKDETY